MLFFSEGGVFRRRKQLLRAPRVTVGDADVPKWVGSCADRCRSGRLAWRLFRRGRGRLGIIHRSGANPGNQSYV